MFTKFKILFITPLLFNFGTSDFELHSMQVLKNKVIHYKFNVIQHLTFYIYDININTNIKIYHRQHRNHASDTIGYRDFLFLQYPPKADVIFCSHTHLHCISPHYHNYSITSWQVALYFCKFIFDSDFCQHVIKLLDLNQLTSANLQICRCTSLLV